MAEAQTTPITRDPPIGEDPSGAPAPKGKAAKKGRKPPAPKRQAQEAGLDPGLARYLVARTINFASLIRVCSDASRADDADRAALERCLHFAAQQADELVGHVSDFTEIASKGGK